jgi:predicted RNase H-like HicB family nuclease
MSRYVALIDGEASVYGVTIPDLPGCTAMGNTIEEAITNAVEAMREWVEITEDAGGTVATARPAEVVHTDPDVAEALAGGAMPTTIELVRHTPGVPRRRTCPWMPECSQPLMPRPSATA